MKKGIQSDKKEKLKEMISQIQDLPTLPAMATQMNELLVDPQTTATQIGQLISSDPVLTSKILKIVNSSFYGFPQPITTVKHAIVVLGFDSVQSVVLSLSVLDLDSGNHGNLFDVKAFWEHSLSVGACARVLARFLNYSNCEEFFVSGLLHDIGKIIFKKYFASEFDQAITISQKRGLPLVVAEEEVFGLHHAQLAGELLMNWNLSPRIVRSIAYHHDPKRAPGEIKEASMIHLADILARALCLGSGGDYFVPAIQEEAWQALDLKEEYFTDFLRESWEEATKARVFLNFL